jgi:hypothetical protein
LDQSISEQSRLTIHRFRLPSGSGSDAPGKPGANYLAFVQLAPIRAMTGRYEATILAVQSGEYLIPGPLAEESPAFA